MYHTKAILLGYSYAEDVAAAGCAAGYCTNTGEVHYTCNSDSDLQGVIDTKNVFPPKPVGIVQGWFKALSMAEITVCWSLKRNVLMRGLITFKQMVATEMMAMFTVNPLVVSKMLINTPSTSFVFFHHPHPSQWLHQTVRQGGNFRRPIRELGRAMGVLLRLLVQIVVLIVKIVLLLVVSTVKVVIIVVLISASLFR